MPRAFLLGGTGQIGRGVARRLSEGGWSVVAASRGTRAVPDELTELGVGQVVVDRTAPGELDSALGDGADVLIDVIPYTVQDAHQLLRICERCGSLVAISSASVYVDDRGRSLDEAESDEDLPRFSGPISESQPTVAPGDASYSTRKAAVEQLLLSEAKRPTTVLRPAAIHGPGSRQAREWFFLKRALDRRPAVPLAYGGESTFHTTSARNLGELVRLAAESPGTRVLNCGDPDPPSVTEIAAAIFDAADHAPELVPFPGAPPAPGVGETPWSTPHPFVLDMSAASRELRYEPLVDYRAAVAETCRWLVDAIDGDDWRAVLPDLAAYPYELFAYEAEDEFLARRAEGRQSR